MTASLKLELPTLQNWSCHNCGGCCKQHGIYITEAEKERIEKQGWNETNGVPKDQPIFVKMGGVVGSAWHRLAHKPDGGCVFLDEKGLCRIHAKFGEPAKPLACRIYPYAFHPTGKGVTIGLRFSCPSVVANVGRPVAQQRSDLLELARQVVPENLTSAKPPAISPKETLSWPDFHRVVAAVDDSFEDESELFLKRLVSTVTWVTLLGQAEFAKIQGERVDDLLGILREAAWNAAPDSPDEVQTPSSVGRTQFRLLAGHYARKDTYGSKDNTLFGRLRLLRSALKLTAGKGKLPAIQSAFKEVPFEQLEQPFGVPEGTAELFTRYFRVKIQGLSFCGPAYYNVALVEGFQSLALVYPAVMWIARWLAAGHGRTTLAFEDVADALSIADHHHGYSPAFGTWGFRKRVRTLAELNDISALAAWYSR
ncbi:MAG TPA: YkgJ family cysteine cluster protein [Caulifigura sp.]|nr:YkgJ family cysteine cluster protein [Caulifigura sp.]